MPNNRSTTIDSYFGNVGGLISNLVDPIVKGVRHTKKTNCITNPNVSGNVNSGIVKPTVYNPNERVSTTHREMYEEKLSMNHLNVQKQDSTAYMNTRPLLNSTQRNSVNTNQSGPAQSSTYATKNYQAEYNQKNKTRVTACDVQNHGNMNLFNNKMNVFETNKELCNSRQNSIYNPQRSNYSNPIEQLGTFTNMPQEYPNQSKDNMDSSLLNAFKQNPYTQSLQSVV